MGGLKQCDVSLLNPPGYVAEIYEILTKPSFGRLDSDENTIRILKDSLPLVILRLESIWIGLRRLEKLLRVCSVSKRFIDFQTGPIRLQYGLRYDYNDADMAPWTERSSPQRRRNSRNALMMSMSLLESHTAAGDNQRSQHDRLSMADV